MKCLNRLIALLLCTLMLGCALPERVYRPLAVEGPELAPPYQTETFQKSVHIFNAVDLLPIVEAQRWSKRVDNILVILDDAGFAGAQEAEQNQMSYAREILRRFHRTMPNQSWTGMLMTTGDGPQVTINVGPLEYNPLNVEAQLDAGKRPPSIGHGALAYGIDRAADIAIALPGRTAIYLITKWSRLDDAATNAIARYHQRITHGKGLTVNRQSATAWRGREASSGCFHAIGIGSRFSREKFLDVTNCASAETFGAIAQPYDMANFVLRTLYVEPRDSDGDGIPDYLDQCSGTPPDRLVNSQGCLRFPDSNKGQQK